MGLSTGLALLLSFVVLLRFFVTSLGEESYGRLWHLYASYSTLGFVRRALWGSMLHLLGLTALPPYWLAYGTQVVLLGTVAAVLLRAAQPAQGLKASIYAALILSPALLPHAAYLPANSDLLLFLLWCFLCWKARSPLAIALGLSLGLLTHEIFIIGLPLLLYILWEERSQADQSPTKQRELLQSIGVAALTSISVLALLTLEGRLTLAESAYQRQMTAAGFEAALHVRGSDGYFELSSTIEQNLQVYGINVQQLLLEIPYLGIAVTYLGFLLYETTKNSPRQAQRLLLASTLLVPVTLSILGHDLYRWLGWCAKLSIIYLLYRARSAPLVWHPLRLQLLLALSLLSPWGAILQRPFPLQQSIMERLASPVE